MNINSLRRKNVAVVKIIKIIVSLATSMIENFTLYNLVLTNKHDVVTSNNQTSRRCVVLINKILPEMKNNTASLVAISLWLLKRTGKQIKIMLLVMLAAVMFDKIPM